MPPRKKDGAAAKPATRRATKAPEPRLGEIAVLARFMVNLLGFDAWEGLAGVLQPAEGKAAAGGLSAFCGALLAHSRRRKGLLDDAALRRLDDRVAEVSTAVNAHRGDAPITWRYFQYVGLLWTEWFLEQLLADREGLRAQLNAWLADGAGLPEGAPAAALARGWRFRSAEENDQNDQNARSGDDLDKLAYWQATGSGKTLILHANILQHRRALARFGLRPVDQTILLVPTRTLAEQHRAELLRSGLRGVDHDDPERRASDVVVLEITALAEKKGVTTVPVARFEGRNLVLVDEGHRGQDEDGVWRGYRAALARGGFSFEYSATFAQAVSGRPAMLEEYGKCVLVDYSFARFHRDGYGKHFRVMNVPAEVKPKLAGLGLPEGDPARDLTLRRYLTGALMVLAQQLRVFGEDPALAQTYNIHKPLCVFVGNSVLGKKDGTLSPGEESDLLRVMRVLAELCAPQQRAANIRVVFDLINGQHEFLRGPKGAGDRTDLFGRLAVFPAYDHAGLSAEQIYDDLLQRVFNTRQPGRLHLVELRRAAGELALSAGPDQTRPFAVVNVGDAGGLRRRAADQLGDLIEVTEDSFHERSLFGAISESRSPITVLLGSRKFSEGWSSWRVSMLGLLNLGKSAGTQIIQLFGRGVRLLGKDRSLKRSTGQVGQPIDSTLGRLRLLELFTVFGVNADYMDKFEEELDKEGLTEGNGEEEEVERPQHAVRLPTLRSAPPEGLLLVLPPAVEFEVGAPPVPLWRPRLRVVVGEAAPWARLRPRHVVLDLYPRMQATTSLRAPLVLHQRTIGAYKADGPVRWHELLDHDALYTALRRFRDGKKLSRLALPRLVPDERPGAAPGAVVPLTAALLRGDWYTLLAPAAMFDLNGVGDRPLSRIPLWTRVATELLTEHALATQAAAERQYTTDHARVVRWGELSVAEKAALLPEAHELHFDVDPSQDSAGLLAWLEKLGAELKAGRHRDAEHGAVAVFGSDVHLYRPLVEALPSARLIHLSGRPVPLDAHERRFVDDVQAYVASKPAALEGATVRLLRNEVNAGEAVRVGFSAGGDRYFPDFMLWINRDDRQHLVFVDTKGLVHLGSVEGRDKVDLHRVLRRIEERGVAARAERPGGRADPPLHLDAWIVSSTPQTEAPFGWDATHRAHADRIVFPSPDRRKDLSHLDRVVRATLAWASLEHDDRVHAAGSLIAVGAVRLRGAPVRAIDAADARGLSAAQRAAAATWVELHPEAVSAARARPDLLATAYGAAADMPSAEELRALQGADAEREPL